MQIRLDSFQVPSGDAAHAEPLRWYYVQWFGYFLMGSLQCDAVCPLQSGSAMPPWSTTISPVGGEGTSFLEPLNNFGRQEAYNVDIALDKSD